MPANKVACLFADVAARSPAAAPALLMMLLGCALSACGTMQVGERMFIRPDPPVADGAAAPVREQGMPKGVAVPAATVSDKLIALDEGATVRGIELDQPGARVTILYFGGNAFHIDAHARYVLPVLAACHANVLMFDYRGYGRSDGKPTVYSMQQDALRIFDLANAAHPGQVVVHGQSLGSFVAAYVAQQRPVAGLVLESTSTNVRDWANANVPWYAKPFLTIEIGPTLRDIDNIHALSGYQGPALVMVGAHDAITPPKYAQQVYAGLPGMHKRLVVNPAAGHNDVLEDAATDAAYCAFIGSVGGVAAR